MDELAFADAVTLAGKIRRKEISSLEMLNHYLNRVERYNPDINAVILLQAEKARSRAEAADAALAKGEAWGPLHGVPMTVMNAIEFLVCSRSFAQLVDMITKLRKDINDYRGGQQTSAHADDAAKTSGQGDKFEDMDPMQLAEILEQGGAKLPGILSRLRKQVENTKERQ
jgi:hypothetical protein